MLPQLKLTQKNKSITEQYSPLYRKSIKNPQKKPQTTHRQEHNKVLSMIDELDVILTNRLSVHEQELLKVMRLEVIRVLQDLKKIVKVYNQMIEEKNLSHELWETRNQADYFRYEAVKLFNENNSLRKQIIQLNEAIESYHLNDACQAEALKKMAKKLMKQKSLRSANHRQYNHKSLNKRNKVASTSRIATQESPLSKFEKTRAIMHSTTHHEDNPEMLSKGRSQQITYKRSNSKFKPLIYKRETKVKNRKEIDLMSDSIEKSLIK